MARALTEIKNCKIGDRIRVFLDSRRMYTESIETIYFIDVVLGMSDIKGNDYIIVWNNKEPYMGWGLSTAKNYPEELPGVRSAYAFGWAVSGGTRCLPLNQVTAATPPTTPPLNNAAAEPTPEWRVFRNAIPGECACGRPLKGCPYHDA